MVPSVAGALQKVQQHPTPPALALLKPAQCEEGRRRKALHGKMAKTSDCRPIHHPSHSYCVNPSDSSTLGEASWVVAVVVICSPSFSFRGMTVSLYESVCICLGAELSSLLFCPKLQSLLPKHGSIRSVEKIK